MPLKQVIEGNIEERMELAERRRRRRRRSRRRRRRRRRRRSKQLLDDFKERRGYGNLRKKHSIALYGELGLEGAMGVSSERL